MGLEHESRSKSAFSLASKSYSSKVVALFAFAFAFGLFSFSVALCMMDDGWYDVIRCDTCMVCLDGIESRTVRRTLWDGMD